MGRQWENPHPYQGESFLDFRAWFSRFMRQLAEFFKFVVTKEEGGDVHLTGNLVMEDGATVDGVDLSEIDWNNLGGVVDLSDYVRRDGTTPFTGPQRGVTPVNPNDLATKGYVDLKVESVGGGGGDPVPVSGVLNDLDDVVTTGAVAGNSLVFNGSLWVPQGIPVVTVGEGMWAQPILADDGGFPRYANGGAASSWFGPPEQAATMAEVYNTGWEQACLSGGYLVEFANAANFINLPSAGSGSQIFWWDGAEVIASTLARYLVPDTLTWSDFTYPSGVVGVVGGTQTMKARRAIPSNDGSVVFVVEAYRVTGTASSNGEWIQVLKYTDPDSYTLFHQSTQPGNWNSNANTLEAFQIIHLPNGGLMVVVCLSRVQGSRRAKTSRLLFISSGGALVGSWWSEDAGLAPSTYFPWWISAEKVAVSDTDYKVAAIPISGIVSGSTSSVRIIEPSGVSSEHTGVFPSSYELGRPYNITAAARYGGGGRIIFGGNVAPDYTEEAGVYWPALFMLKRDSLAWTFNVLWTGNNLNSQGSASVATVIQADPVAKTAIWHYRGSSGISFPDPDWQILKGHFLELPED